MIPLYSGYYALVVGCGDYRAGWPRLPNLVKDAREVAGVLKGMGWTVKLLEDPHGSALVEALNRLVAEEGKKPDQGVLFWFSGHGHTLAEADGSKLGFLVPVDAPDPETDEYGFMNRAVSMRQIETVAKRIRAKHVLMAFDSCFSGAIFQMVRAKPSAYIQEKVKEPVRQFITAGDENEQVPDRSVFKEVFLQGISKGYADQNRDSYVTGEELGAYLQEQVVNYSRSAQHPQFGKINNPRLDKGDFVFVASNAAVIETPGDTGSAGKTTLYIEANVSGAEVFVDGKRAGAAPLSGFEVSAGRRQILMQKKGYRTYQKSVQVESGRSLSLSVFLDPETAPAGRLFVETDPAGATVRILNIGETYQPGMELAAGSYKVEVSATGYEKKVFEVTLRAGEDRRLDVRLDPVAAAQRAPIVGGAPGIMMDSCKELYDEAKQAYDHGDLEKARNGFESIIKAFPKCEEAAAAQFWIGETYYQVRWYEKAILEYQKVIENYPDANKVAAALLKQGLAFLNIGDKIRSRLILQDLVRRYPSSNEGRIADVKLKELN
jgi:tol-pal system protein YbgF